MVDESPQDGIRSESLGDRPLRCLYLDMNAYFATVEQAEKPELRGRPIAVVPLMADTTFIIAASVESKRFGIKTGMQVGEAKRRLPELELVQATPALYTYYHRRILQVLGNVLPVDRVCSIDEMRFRLLGEETKKENAEQIAKRMKAALKEGVAENVTCSIGIAPNSFLAKLGTDMMKPDGLVVIESRELPDRIRGLKLTEFSGINKKMEARLRASGIFRSDDLFDKTEDQLEQAFGSVMGRRWWRLLRGYEADLDFESGKSLSHSHVLPPELRTDQGCRDVLLRLTHKAAARMRSNGFYAQFISISVKGMRKSWHAETRMSATHDTLTLTEKVLELWKGRDFESPLQVGVAFTALVKEDKLMRSLFDDSEELEEREAASKALDALNQKFGKNTVYLASLDKVKSAASEKIAFNKTWLFSEGKDDNEWPDTFRGLQDK